MEMNRLWQVGIDVGSTTVKAVVMDGRSEIRWKRYQRHNTRQAQQVRDLLARIEEEFEGDLRVFITGSGARALAPSLNAQYIQEVNAVSLAVETLCPDTGSALELGGQDAKVIIWSEDSRGRRSTQAYMNDKCAGGTGATIDKILGKIGITHEEAAAVDPRGKTVHNIAAKCGVFAETDVVGLLKSGTDREEIVVSLLTAIARQNLEVLVRGNVLKDRVLLLGGPHTYLKNFAEIWRGHIPEAWRIQGWEPQARPLEELIYVPEDAQYFAAIGAVLYGLESEDMLTTLRGDGGQAGAYGGLAQLDHYIEEGRIAQLMASGAVRDGLVSSKEEVEVFSREYSVPAFDPPAMERGGSVDCYMGIDGGSTSSKLVIIDSGGELIHKDYMLSSGNPIDDVRDMFERMERWCADKGVALRVIGTAITGYASAILKEAFSLDLAVVETVAHMRAAVRYYGEVDIICDVGGQDIKVLFMKHGRVVDFKLNTQCSAGNGYFLQGMAEQFDIPIEKYAECAFRAQKAPAFNYGCAVFMEQDRVNFQQLGWTSEEIMAGLALVLPLNIWNYVVQEPHIARFGNRVVLQGGTQNNLAAVKAQVDFIRSKVPDARVHVHRYADICGAIGAALECRDRMAGQKSVFIGIEAAARVTFASRNDETTRCSFCQNRCPRTFVDIRLGPARRVRFISGYGCAQGMDDNVESMRARKRKRDQRSASCPNLVHQAAVEVFGEFDFDPLPENGAVMPAPGEGRGPGRRFAGSSRAVMARREKMVVGILRLLNMYLYTPFFSTYFKTLGVGRLVYSDYTSERLWAEGNKWGAIDPCFPAKVAPAHIHNLLARKDLTHICFPMITHLESQVGNTLGNNACVIQMGTPEVVHAVFTRGRDHFAERGLEYWKPLVRMDNPPETCGMLFDYFGARLDMTRDENEWAVRQGYGALQRYLAGLRHAGARILNDLVETDSIGIVLLGHPYHHDPGFNHGIPEEFQMRGFPILSIESLPVDGEFLEHLFGDGEGGSGTPPGLDIKDVWVRNFNRNTNLKFWAAKVASRHPNLAVVDLSSFKCGHDAPTYSYIGNIMDASETPHFLIHDIDQNKPSASLAIRIQTIEYFLRLEEERLRRRVEELQHG